MRKIIYSTLILLLLCINNALYSQTPPPLQWAINLPGTTLGYDMALDPSGNPHVAGSSTGAFVGKYNTSGALQWSFTLGLTLAATAHAIVVDGSSNVYVTGRFTNTVDFDPSGTVFNLVSSSAGVPDIFVAKYSSTGTFINAFKIGGINFDQPNDISVDAAGNILLTGRFLNVVDFDPSLAGVSNLSTSATFSDAFVAKYTPALSLIWAFQLGSTNNDEGWSIASDAGNNVYVTGQANGTIDFNPSVAAVNNSTSGLSNPFLAKYDAGGNYQWAFFITGPVTATPQSLRIDAASNVIISGYTFGVLDFDPGAPVANNIYSNNGDAFVAKYSSSGAYIWSFSIGGTGSDNANAVGIDPIGDVYITGTFTLTMDFDPSSTSAFNLTANNADIFVAKYSGVTGLFQWAFNVFSIGNNEAGRSVAFLPSGEFYISGQFEGLSADFDPSGGSATPLASSGTTDIFIAKYNNLVPLPIELIHCDCENKENVIEINWSTGTETNNDYFTILKSIDGVDFSEIGMLDGAGNSSFVNNYSFTDNNPNPDVNYYRLKQTDFDGQSKTFPLLACFNKNGGDNENETFIEIYDLYGKLIYKNKNKSTEIDLGLSQGLYILKTGTKSKKIIITQ